MITKEQKFRLGVFLTIATMVVLAVLVILIYPKMRESGHVYPINFSGTSVNGLEIGAEVKYQGVKIGKTHRIRVNSGDLSSILVLVKIESDFPVKKDMRASLQFAGITGLKFIELSKGSTSSGTLNPGELIETERGLGEKAEDIVTHIDQAIFRINQLLNDDNQKKINLFLEDISKTSSVLSDVIGNRKNGMENVLIQMEKAAAEFSDTAKQLSRFTENLQQTFPREKMEKISTSGADMIENIADRFSKEELGRVIDNFDVFVTSTGSSLKKIENVLLMQQEELSRSIHSLAEAMDNIAKFSRQLAEDPTILIRTKSEKRRKK